jgi:Kef-type K+ transport system membrane component KefB
MAQEVLFGIGAIIIISAIVTILARVIRQPPIIAYLISGIIVGPLLFNLVGSANGSAEFLQTISRFGVAFLLFIVGLSLDFRLLKEIGKISAITGTIQVAIVSFLGFLISMFFGFDKISATYIGVALAFSSTVVVVKILSDKKEIDTLHGRIALGILIIQDILASIALMIIPLLTTITNYGSTLTIIREILIAIGFIIFIFIISKFVFTKFMNYLAKSQETLFLFGIAWALAIATVFYKLGFSMEIGALIGGMSLASSKYALELEGKMKPLRDFFIVLFFVFFGSQLTSINLVLIKQALILSLFVMLIKPMIVMYTLKILGYTKKTNFLTSVSLAQVSEFSLILIMLGFSFGVLSQQIMNLAVLIALITIGTSTYVISYSHWLHKKLERFLDVFDGKLISDKTFKRESFDIILFGYHRIGYKLLETLKNSDKKLLIVDYNPSVVLTLQKQKINSIFGDAGNKNFLNELPLDKAKLIISTIPEEHSNMIIREALEELNSKAVFIATAEQPRDALSLYRLGVDYVLIPHHLGGDFAAKMINEYGTNKEKYVKIGKEHRHDLEKSKNNSTFNKD